MPTLPLHYLETSAPSAPSDPSAPSALNAQKPRDCSTPLQLTTVGVLGLVVCVALLSIAIGSIGRRRAKKLSAELKTATSELIVQQRRILSLGELASRQNAYILRNIRRNPKAYSATPHEDHPEPSGAAGSSNEMVGMTRKDENCDSDGSGKENAWLAGEVAEQTPQFATAISMVKVQPGEIKKITLSPRKLQTPGAVSLDKLGARAGGEAGVPPKVRRGGGSEREAALDRHPPRSQNQNYRPQPAGRDNPARNAKMY